VRLQFQEKAVSVGLGEDHDYRVPSIEGSADERGKTIQKILCVRIELNLVSMGDLQLFLEWFGSNLALQVSGDS